MIRSAFVSVSFRPIVVDDTKYQWQFDRVLTVYADTESSTRGQQLVADWGWVDWLEPEYRNTPPFDPHVVTPAFVRAAIQFAVSDGWRPNEKGEPFRITYQKGQFRRSPDETL